MLEKTEHYYHSLYQIAATVNSIHASGAILRTIVVNIARALDVKGCSLMLLTPDGKQLLHTAAYGLSSRYVGKGPVAADKSLSAALEGKAVSVRDAASDRRVQYRAQAKEEGIASMLSAPMMLRERIIGVIRVYSAEPREFTPEDIYFVSAVANLGAIALENTRLYEAVQTDYATLAQEMLDWRASLGHDWTV